MSNISVFIADNEQVLVDALMQGLNRIPGISVVGTAINPEQLLDRLFPGKAAVLLLDIFSTGSKFLELISTLAKRDSNLRIIIMSGRQNFSFAQETLNAGAHYYTSKNLRTAELAALIRSVVNENATGIQFYDTSPQKKDLAKEVKDALTSRELEILKELCKGARNDLEIAEALSINAESTVAAHRRNMKRKFTDYGLNTATSIGYWAAKWNFFPDIDSPE